jgi:uncharacterized protein YfaP (DUF2135 family)
VRAVLAAAVALAAAAAAASAEDPPAPAAPVVRITSPRGGQTGERVIAIRAQVEGYRGGRATLVLNGVPMSVAATPAGPGGALRAVDVPQVLSPGLNSIRVLVEQDGRTAEDGVSVYAQVPAKDLRVTLTWDRPATDVDLWVTGPDGEKVMYSNRQGKAGGTLDTDVTTGFGPETYTHARLRKGTYRLQAHYYGASEAAPCRVEVTTVRFEGTPEEERRVFRGVLLEPGDVLEVGEVLSR